MEKIVEVFPYYKVLFFLHHSTLILDTSVISYNKLINPFLEFLRNLIISPSYISRKPNIHTRTHPYTYIHINMDIELVKCVCCGLKEDCTQDYISEVKAKFDGKWLCGLCSEAVRDEVNRGKKQCGTDEAVKAHMSFCRKYKSNPAVRVADGMRQMLIRRRSGDMTPSSQSSSSSSSSKKYSRSSSSISSYY
ncbi:hypothetical protein ABFX02_14G018300 [Erythranthe guttata]